MRPVAVVSLVLTLAACGGSEPAEPAKPACDLATSGLAGKTFVMLEATPDGDVENAQARVLFEEVEGKLTARYTSKSLANVYSYDCEEKDGEIACMAEFNTDYACKALETNKAGTCTVETLRGFGAKDTDEELAKIIEASAKQTTEARKARGATWERWQLLHNNVGSAVQGRLYVRIDEERCRIDVDDVYALIYNGKLKEDTNPVGSNAFVRSDKTFLFEDCPQQRVLANLTTAEQPKDLASIPAGVEHNPGEPAYYHYVGPDGLKAEEGCTYAVDTYANWEPAAKDVAITPGEDGNIHWMAEHTWTAGPRIPIGGGHKGTVFHVVRKKTCAGKTEQIDVTCNAAVVH